MPPVQVLIKPASGRCNLACRYCFYRDLTARRACADRGLMSAETREAVVRRVFDEAEGWCAFAFQGGEPLLAGLEFYRGFLRLCEKRNAKGLPVRFSIQTNGTLIDERWAAFFAENHFLVGLSIDGPETLNDANRVDAAGEGAYRRVLNAAKLLNKFHAEYNVLAVVTDASAARAEEIYRFFRKKNWLCQQYIPCLDPLGSEGASRLSPESWAKFLNTVFRLWHADWLEGRNVRIRLFENYIGMLRGLPPESCAMCGRCSCQFVVEADGSVYPCDFYALDEYRLGSIRDDSLPALLKRFQTGAFAAERAPAPAECRACEWFALCRGGCRRYQESGKDRLCAAYRAFFAENISALLALAGQV